MTTAPIPHSPVPTKDFYLGRQAILNPNQSLAAYELPYRSADNGPASVTDNLCATSNVIAHASPLGLENVVGNSRAFVNVDAVALLCNFVRFLPRDDVVLEILEMVEATDEIVSRVAQLRKAGYTFALDDVTTASDNAQRFLPLVNIIKIDITDIQQSELALLCRQFQGSGKRLSQKRLKRTASSGDASISDSIISKGITSPSLMS